MPTMGKHTLLLAVLLATPLAYAQSDPPIGHPQPPDTSINRIQADLGRDAMITPLKISYGKPLNAKPTDKTQSFQFQLGTGF